MTNSQKTSLLRVRPAAVSVILLSAAACTLVIATGCGKTSKAAAKQEPLEVQVTEVRQRDVPIYKEWIGTLDGFVNADIKAQFPVISYNKPTPRGPSSAPVNCYFKSIPGRSRRTWTRRKPGYQNRRVNWSRRALN